MCLCMLTMLEHIVHGCNLGRLAQLLIMWQVHQGVLMD